MTEERVALTDAECDAIADRVLGLEVGADVNRVQRVRQRALIRAGFQAGAASRAGAEPVAWRQLIGEGKWLTCHGADPREVHDNGRPWEPLYAAPPAAVADEGKNWRAAFEAWAIQEFGEHDPRQPLRHEFNRMVIERARDTYRSTDVAAAWAGWQARAAMKDSDHAGGLVRG